LAGAAFSGRHCRKTVNIPAKQDSRTVMDNPQIFPDVFTCELFFKFSSSYDGMVIRL